MTRVAGRCPQRSQSTRVKGSASMTEDPLFGTSIHQDVRTALHWEGRLDDLSQLTRWLGPVQDLDLESCPVDIRRLLDAAPNLRGLRLASCALNANAVAALVDHPHAAALTRLDLSGNNFGPEGLERLARSSLGVVHLALGPHRGRGDWLGTPVGVVAELPNLLSLACNAHGFTGLGHFPARLTRLDLGGGGDLPGRDTLVELARAPAAAQLHELVYPRQRMRDEDLLALAELHHLKRLRAPYNELTDAAPFSRGSWEALDLTYNQLSAAGVRTLRELATLRELRLAGKVGEAGLALAGGAALPELEILELRSRELGDADLAALAGEKLRLVHLELEGCFTDQGLKALAAAPWFAGLRRLTLRGPFAGKLLETLAMPALESLELEPRLDSAMSVSRMLNRQPALRRLTLSHWPDGFLEDGPAQLERLRIWRAIGNFERAPQLANLRILELSRAGVLDQDVERFLPRFPQLERLDLGCNDLGDLTARALASGPPTLRRLDLRSNQIRRGALALADSPHLAGLECLDMRSNPLREDEDIWYDQGFPVGSTPADPEALILRARFGRRLRL